MSRAPRQRWARPLQLAALTLSVLCGGGYYALSVSNVGSAAVTLPGNLPSFTLLLAGRDITYCYYRQPCKDQNQRQGVIQTANTDTLMLVKVRGTRVDVLSIPRDTNVGDFDPELSVSAQKVNGRYWEGGPQGLVSAAETITGERIDHYLIVRTDEVARVIDALGGLDVNVQQPQGIEWIDQAAGVDLKLAQGQHHLAGQEAVWYLRVRKGVGDDYGRIDHQKQALSQLASKLPTARGLSALPSIIGVMNRVETNLDPNIIQTVRPVLGQYKLSFATLPTTTIRGNFNLAVDREKLLQIWGNLGASPDTATPDSASQPGNRVTLLLQDASGTNLGEKMAGVLRRAGYSDIQVSRAPVSAERSQVFTQSDVSVAQNLADLLNLPRLQGERFPLQPGQVGLMLGNDASTLFAALSRYTPLP